MPGARDLSNKAVELAESGQYEEAFNLLRQGIETDANKAFTTHKKLGRPRVTIDYEKVRAVMKNGLSEHAAFLACGYHRTTFYKWKRQQKGIGQNKTEKKQKQPEEKKINENKGSERKLIRSGGKAIKVPYELIVLLEGEGVIRKPGDELYKVYKEYLLFKDLVDSMREKYRINDPNLYMAQVVIEAFKKEGERIAELKQYVYEKYVDETKRLCDELQIFLNNAVLTVNKSEKNNP